MCLSLLWPGVSVSPLKRSNAHYVYYCTYLEVLLIIILVMSHWIFWYLLTVYELSVMHLYYYYFKTLWLANSQKIKDTNQGYQTPPQ